MPSCFREKHSPALREERARRLAPPPARSGQPRGCRPPPASTHRPYRRRTSRPREVTFAGLTIQIAICRDFDGSDGGQTHVCHPTHRDTTVAASTASDKTAARLSPSRRACSAPLYRGLGYGQSSSASISLGVDTPFFCGPTDPSQAFVENATFQDARHADDPRRGHRSPEPAVI